MLLGVVGCPHCKRVQVVDAAAARASCRGCTRAFGLADRKRFYVGDDAEAARLVAAKMALQAGGAPIESIAEAVQALERDRSVSLEDVIEGLRARHEFESADVEEALLEARLRTTAARVVESLRQSNRVYEPRPGRFRWIG